MLRVAVVGLGWWGRIIVGLLKGSDKLHVACGVDTSPIAESFAAQSGISFRKNFEEIEVQPLP